MADHLPSTRAILFLKQHHIAFTPHTYDYRGGSQVAKQAAEALSMAPERMIKTLVFLVDGKPVLALLDAESRLSVSKLAQAAGSKERAAECSSADAERHSGYKVGGISPFATRRAMPVFVDSHAASQPSICVNGGSHGLIVEVSPHDLISALQAIVADLRQA